MLARPISDRSANDQPRPEETLLPRGTARALAAPDFGIPVMGKTGTTNDFRDNWTMGYVPKLAVGVWVGNADNTEMQAVTGLTGAAPGEDRIRMNSIKLT